MGAPPRRGQTESAPIDCPVGQSQRSLRRSSEQFAYHGAERHDEDDRKDEAERYGDDRNEKGHDDGEGVAEQDERGTSSREVRIRSAQVLVSRVTAQRCQHQPNHQKRDPVDDGCHSLPVRAFAQGLRDEPRRIWQERHRKKKDQFQPKNVESTLSMRSVMALWAIHAAPIVTKLTT